MKAYTVSQVNGYIKNMFVKDMLLGNISIQGEVSNCKYHTSGHIYFTLKDGMSQLMCVMFAGQRMKLKFRLEEGQSVIVTGNISVYERDGRYQMYAASIELDGLGQLYERFEKLKETLYNEGLFDASHKKPIPQFAKKIGIVTASTGAALQDMIHISNRRNPYVQLYLYPAQVQGFGAAESIVRAIKRLDCMGMDVLIVGRGGGSIEDLWAFNEEIVARAVYECQTPVISAVGHETDYTMIDFVSDLRAPTPSAAAELAVYEITGVMQTFAGYHSDLARAMLQKIEKSRNQAEERKKALFYLSPQAKLNDKKQQAADYSERITRLMRERLVKERRTVDNNRQILELKKEHLRRSIRVVTEKRRHQLALYISALKGLSPLDKLNQGYSYTAFEQGGRVDSIRDVKVNDRLAVSIKDGIIMASVTGVKRREEDNGTEKKERK